MNIICSCNNQHAHHICFFSQCICNSFTYNKPVPTATPTRTVTSDPSSAPSISSAPSASAAPSAFGGDRVDDGGLGDANYILPSRKDSCQVYNDKSMFYKEPHPYQSFSEFYDTCASGDECPPGSCCTTGWCLCMATQDDKYCLPGYSLLDEEEVPYIDAEEQVP